MSFLGYTTKVIKCYPLTASGPTVTSAATAWSFGIEIELVPVDTITVDFVITHLVALEDPAAALDTRHQALFRLRTTAVIIAYIPVTYLIDSAVGHLAPWVFPLPVPAKVAANSTVRIAVADSVGVARTYGGCKIVYIELPYT